MQNVNLFKGMTRDWAADVSDTISQRIAIRTYGENTVGFEWRRTTTMEAEVIYHTAYAALCEIMSASDMYDKETVIDVAIRTAENTIDNLMPECNGYETLFIPLSKAIDDFFEEQKKIEAQKHRLRVKFLSFKSTYLSLAKELNDVDFDVNDYIDDCYPFSVSFDELGLERWIDNCRENLNK